MATDGQPCCKSRVCLVAPLGLSPLQARLLEMIAVEMAVTTGPDKVPRLKTGLLRPHVGQQRIRRDIAWDAFQLPAEEDTIILHFDGASRDNPGAASCGCFLALHRGLTTIPLATRGPRLTL